MLEINAKLSFDTKNLKTSTEIHFVKLIMRNSLLKMEGKVFQCKFSSLSQFVRLILTNIMKNLNQIREFHRVNKQWSSSKRRSESKSDI